MPTAGIVGNSLNNNKEETVTEIPLKEPQSKLLNLLQSPLNQGLPHQHITPNDQIYRNQTKV